MEVIDFLMETMEYSDRKVFDFAVVESVACLVV